MAVYVDDYLYPFGRMMMSHMIADTEDELMQMADQIGVARKWYQRKTPGGEHFDICDSKRKLAVLRHGAIQVNYRTMAKMVAYRKMHGELPTPEEADKWHAEGRPRSKE